MASRLVALALCLFIPRWLWIGSYTASKQPSLRAYRSSRRAEKEEKDIEDELDSKDWREFRARLVQQETLGNTNISLKKAEKWAYESPIIEQGAILLSSPNDHFCINQQYFHKNVIFLVQHGTGIEGFTKGVILNRPTAFTTNDLESLKLQNFSHEGADDWNVWCGGDCQGINSRLGSVPVEYSVLHGLERLKDCSETITNGVYSINLDDAKALVAAGKADKDDFLLLVGYCGWTDGQLQSELDRQDTWTMASIDPSLLLGQLREEQAPVCTCLNTHIACVWKVLKGAFLLNAWWNERQCFRTLKGGFTQKNCKGRAGWHLHRRWCWWWAGYVGKAVQSTWPKVRDYSERVQGKRSNRFFHFNWFLLNLYCCFWTIKYWACTCNCKVLQLPCSGDPCSGKWRKWSLRWNASKVDQSMSYTHKIQPRALRS